jgi:hypothetical protein
MCNTARETAQQKVEAIFRDAFGERAARVFTHHNVAPTMEVVCEAFANELPPARAEALGFNMADWGRDAAFVIALHLYPERFTAEEIREATDCLAAHVPYHVSAVADLLDYPEIEPYKTDENAG